MLRLVVVVAFLTVCWASPSIKDCAPGGSAVRVNRFDIEPHPVRIPGPVSFTLDGEVLRPVTDFNVNITIIKDNNGFPLKVPCLENLGSCYYRYACPFLSGLFPDGQCPPFLGQCTCPFKKGRLQIEDFTLTIPPLPGAISEILSGKFELILAIHDSLSRKMLSCTQAKLEIRAGYLYLL